MLTLTDETICFVGDIHGSLNQGKAAVRYAKVKNTKTIIQVGDFGLYPNHVRYLEELNKFLERENITLYFIDGNHEDFNFLETFPVIENGTRLITDNIIHLPRGLVFKWNDKHVMAMGGAYSVDQKHRTPGLDWFIEETITEDQINKAIENAGSTKIDLLVTHDSPASCYNEITDVPMNQINGIRLYGIDQIEQAHENRLMLDKLYHAVKPKIVIHGHYHSDFIGRGTHGNVIGLHEGSVGVKRNTFFLTTNDFNF